MRIVFLGTPDFAATILDKLVDEGKNIVAVITAPDKPAGRGKKIQMSAVKKTALKHELPILQPTNLKSEEFLTDLKNYNAELQIVVAFRMLPEVVWNMPPRGTFNLHASLLPQYRGAAPINWAVINGEQKTGVTTFFLKHKIDTGDVIDQTEVEISPEDTAGSLHDKLMHIGAQQVVDSLNKIERGVETTTPQEHLDANQLKEAPKIFKDTCKIDWRRSGSDIHNHIRGLSPYPCSFTRVHLGEKSLGLKVFKSRFENGVGGQVQITLENNGIGVRVKDGTIWLEEIQLEGKRRMSASDFLRGINDTLSLAE